MCTFFALFSVALALPVLWPQIDLIISGLLYRSDTGFFLQKNLAFLTFQAMAYDGARALGIAFVVMAVWRFLHPLPPAGRVRAGGGTNQLTAKAWLFLLLALLIGPGLIANVGFKDHWGRARPREVVEFGGTATFTPALSPQFQNARSNGSFISGDAAFGFFLPAFAYTAPRRLSRRIFWIAMAAGSAFGFARLAMGAHFFSDIVYAAFLMLATTAAIHAAMYGRRETVARWKLWFEKSDAGRAV